MKILSTIDDAEISINTFKSACKLAKRLRYGIAAIHVDRGQEYSSEFIEWGRIQDKIVKELQDISKEVAVRIKDTAKNCMVQADVFLAGGLPATEILNFLNDNGIYKIISMGHSSKTIIEQSVTKTILNNTSIPILVTNCEIEFDDILLYIDDSKTIEKTVKSIIPLLKSLKPVSVTAIMIMPDSQILLNEYKNIAEIPYFKETPDFKRDLDIWQANQRKVLDDAVTLLSNAGIPAQALVRYGDTFNEIKSEAIKHDLLILTRNNIASVCLTNQSLNLLFI